MGDKFNSSPIIEFPENSFEFIALIKTILEYLYTE